MDIIDLNDDLTEEQFENLVTYFEFLEEYKREEKLLKGKE